MIDKIVLVNGLEFPLTRERNRLVAELPHRTDAINAIMDEARMKLAGRALTYDGFAALCTEIERFDSLQNTDPKLATAVRKTLQRLLVEIKKLFQKSDESKEKNVALSGKKLNLIMQEALRFAILKHPDTSEHGAIITEVHQKLEETCGTIDDSQPVFARHLVFAIMQLDFIRMELCDRYPTESGFIHDMLDAAGKASFETFIGNPAIPKETSARGEDVLKLWKHQMKAFEIVCQMEHIKYSPGNDGLLAQDIRGAMSATEGNVPDAIQHKEILYSVISALLLARDKLLTHRGFVASPVLEEMIKSFDIFHEWILLMYDLAESTDASGAPMIGMVEWSVKKNLSTDMSCVDLLRPNVAIGAKPDYLHALDRFMTDTKLACLNAPGPIRSTQELIDFQKKTADAYNTHLLPALPQMPDEFADAVKKHVVNMLYTAQQNEIAAFIERRRVYEEKSKPKTFTRKELLDDFAGTAIPEPATAVLFGIALTGLCGYNPGRRIGRRNF